MVPDYQSNSVSLFLGDCLDVMPTLEAGSIDMVLCDLPYGTTQCAWDAVIPFEPLWREYRRLCAGIVALTAVQPFASALVMSNLRAFKYEWSWDRRVATGALNAKRMPMRAHENVLIFGGSKSTYNPQKIERTPEQVRRLSREVEHVRPACKGVYGAMSARQIAAREQRLFRTPASVIRIPGLNGNNPERAGHPTQKPVALLKYLIRTYTSEGDTILDNTMGSGSTGVACLNTGRGFVGIERDARYFDIAQRRIRSALNPAHGPLFGEPAA